jgi:tRNA U34 5-carboxymethylaminomethyl modifying GTPase MnmE/TrmE
VDTIFSLSSAPGRAGVSVIRVSGPQARSALEDLTGRPPPKAREMRVRTLLDPHDGEPIDQALVVWMPAPHTFTGEDTVELFVHGGVAVVRDTLDALSRMHSLRSAEAGEFTRRAFEHDRLDLTATEGLSDLIRADTTHQRKQALRHANGEFETLLSTWRQQIVDSMARMEACIDFAEEVEASASAGAPGEEAAHVSDVLVDTVRRDLGTLAAHIQRVVQDSRNCGEVCLELLVLHAVLSSSLCAPTSLLASLCTPVCFAPNLSAFRFDSMMEE